MIPTVTVVIPTFNRADLLRLCLHALDNQSIARDAFEIIVVDDGSTDCTAEYLNEREAQVGPAFAWCQQSHAGPSAARNLGLQRARGTFIAFTDDDCVPHQHWLAELLSEMPDDERRAGIGGKIRRFDDNLVGRYIDNAGLMSSWVEDGVVEYLITANALFRADALREIGGFNTNLGRTLRTRLALGGGEDVDVGYRLRDAGYQLAVTEAGVVAHHHHDSVSSFYWMCWRHGYGKGSLASLGPADFDPPTAWDHLKQLVRAVMIPPAGKAGGAGEAVVWRFLGAVQATAVHRGQLAFARDRRQS
jgi:GT2 family glycosyltransferase